MASDKKISAPSDGLGESTQKARALHGRTTGPTRRSTKGQWTPDEDEILRRAVQRFKGKNWKKIAECFKDRTDVQCLHRWQKVLNPELVKGPWSKEEDETIIELVKRYGPKKWSTIAQHLSGRIGKQCRERWHNHLNPSINKEAWTQEEELALIRAHQIYGNKWAELTKYLPGRTDNSIKNHWNSSVKKKLDSYLKSGMLAQFQGLPAVVNQNQTGVSSSLRIQDSGDDSVKKGTEAEEISECSQDSNVAGRCESEMAISVQQTGEEFPAIEVPGSENVPNFNPAFCSDPYYPSLEEPNFLETHDIGFVTKFLQQNFPHDAEGSMSGDYQFDLHDLTNFSSLQEGHEPMVSQSHCHEALNVPLQTYGDLNSTSMEIMHMGSDKPVHMLISDEECCRVLFSEAMKDECFSSRDPDLGCDVPLICQSEIQISDSPLRQPSSNSDVPGPSCSQPFYPRLVSAGDCPISYNGDSNRLPVIQEQDYATCPRDGFIYTNDSANSPCDEELEKGSSKLVPVNSFASSSDPEISQMDCISNPSEEKEIGGGLCYEPPRFPSSDMPFFSCDLIQTGGEMQQEYSPLGIRQFMMTSANCLTPFRLWDSPTRGNSPDAVLKSAAKTFTGTPSIFKKRNREFLSPLSDRRKAKRPEIKDTDRSSLDVFVDDDKKEHKEVSQDQKSNSGDCTEDKENSGNISEDKETQCLASEETDDKLKTNVDHTSQPSPAVLVEHNANILFSPKRLDFRVFCSSSKTPRSTRIKSSCGKQSSENQDSSSALPSQLIGSNAGGDTTVETFTLFGGTPFKRGIESPSAWKSPWFISPFAAGPRVDTDITIEDIGYYLMSPGDQSYDAIGLMKQISEQTAAAYANAQEVLGSKTPRTLLSEKSKLVAREQENSLVSDQPGNNRSHLPQNLSAECRVLDFSECGTPGKSSTEFAKSSTATGFSSPSSYLLKNCR